MTTTPRSPAPGSGHQPRGQAVRHTGTATGTAVVPGAPAGRGPGPEGP